MLTEYLTGGVSAAAVLAFLAWLRARIKDGKVIVTSLSARELASQLAAEKAARFVAESERDHYKQCRDHLEREKDKAQGRTIAILEKLQGLEQVVRENGNGKSHE